MSVVPEARRSRSIEHQRRFVVRRAAGRLSPATSAYSAAGVPVAGSVTRVLRSLMRVALPVRWRR